MEHDPSLEALLEVEIVSLRVRGSEECIVGAHVGQDSEIPIRSSAQNAIRIQAKGLHHIPVIQGGSVLIALLVLRSGC